MQFVSNTVVTISPESPTVCFGTATTPILATGSGGRSPYKYTWNTGETTSLINKGAGTYIVSMTDSLNCMVSMDTVVATAFVAPIKANAGNDTSFCNSRNQVNLNGSVQSAQGGIWNGGAGSYVNGTNRLKGIYIPTSNELKSDSLILKLITTGNGNCAADTDFFVIHFNSTPATQFNPITQACAGITSTYFTNSSGNNRVWTALGGSIVGSNTDLTVQVNWGQTNPASLTIRQSNLNGCDSSITKSIILFNKPPSKVIFHD